MAGLDADALSSQFRTELQLALSLIPIVDRTPLPSDYRSLKCGLVIPISWHGSAHWVDIWTRGINQLADCMASCEHSGVDFTLVIGINAEDKAFHGELVFV
jgi:hypothetical protein